MRSTALLSGIGLQPGTLRAALHDRLTRSLGKNPEAATQRDIYDALSMAVREELAARWLATQRRMAQSGVKRVCYLSVEFLLGRSLINGLASLDGELVQEARESLSELGYDLDRVAHEEIDPGLGNGGLGRLAACFLDSLATLQFPAVGYGIRYDYGIFTQVIDEEGRQREIASSWLRQTNPWEIPRDDARYVVRFGGRCVATNDAQGRTHYRWVDTKNIWAVGSDLLIPGNRSATVNHLRLWAGRAIAPFDVELFNAGRHAEASSEQVDAKNVSRILYPDDTTPQGKELRFKQQYFFVSASLQDMLAQHLAEGRSFETLPNAVAIQLNDTHPALAIPELMRLLIDEHEMEWEQAWNITRAVFSYTNHTLLPEALEVWPVAFFERLLPRHLQIIYLINRLLLDEVSVRYPNDQERKRRVSLIEEDRGRQVRMAHLAVVSSHTVNGVAKLHSELMKRTIFADFADLYPERFTNVTNGIAVRRWLKQSNPGLSTLLTERLGHAWENDLEELERLRWAAEDAEFCDRFRAIKLENKQRLATVIQRRVGVEVDVHSLFDVQVKRIHEYKRQLLNLLHVITRYHRLRANPNACAVPRTVIFAGKAAPGYVMAKSIIKLINNVATVVNTDKSIQGKLRVVFLPDYDVSLAQNIMPAADLSEQISTAGLEASGTGNMKLSLNGALTIGTLDGANIEIREQVGPENIFIFGLTAPEVEERRRSGYSPSALLAGDRDLARTLEMIDSGFFTPANLADGKPVVDRLLSEGEPYFVLADYAAYIAAQNAVDALFLQPREWTRKAVLNTLSMGVFSSDRSIREYAERIWRIKPAL
ncbi:MAG TPA: glycogen/starch/alpha-glucan phosphorylase [Steroidobacteraceae bacterium]|nr:glycogen/starch/alpha-glucan phosphorylase [Steroidobacteraceae bacterium]